MLWFVHGRGEKKGIMFALRPNWLRLSRLAIEEGVSLRKCVGYGIYSGDMLWEYGLAQDAG